MRTIAAKQPARDLIQQKSLGVRRRSQPIVPPSTGISLQRQCACGGGCPRCQSVQTLPSNLQTKLTISEPGDRYEQEADRIADQVMRMPIPPPGQVQPEKDKETAVLQTATSHRGFTPQLEAPSSVNDALRSPGRPLDPVTRTLMETRFGQDFSGVRVHSGAAADRSAQEVSAHAYTVGHNIVFGAGQFAPGTHAGQRLLAHELTHVMQQSGSHPVLQRDFGFEFQLRENKLTTNKGREFPRKAGKFFHRVPPADKHGLELQSESGSFMEFETHHFQKWSDLKAQIQSAVDIVQEIKKDPKAFPFNQEKRLRKEGVLAKDETLEVDIQDVDFKADIQSTEGILLTQYESLLKEHERTPIEYIDPVLKDAQNILNAANTNPL
jgi:hypothetical protein